MHGQAGEDATAFRYGGDTQLHALVRGHVIDGLAVEEDASSPGDKGAGDRLEQGALAGPVGADTGEDLARLHLQVDVVESLEVLVVGADVLDLKQAHAGVPPM